MDGTNVAVGVVGMGLMGRRHAAIYRQLPGVRLAGIAEIDPDARRQAETSYEVAGFAGPRELFAVADLDAVSICLPDNLHREVTLAALDAGLHVLLEKPLATTVADGGSSQSGV